MSLSGAPTAEHGKDMTRIFTRWKKSCHEKASKTFINEDDESSAAVVHENEKSFIAVVVRCSHSRARQGYDKNIYTLEKKLSRKGL